MLFKHYIVQSAVIVVNFFNNIGKIYAYYETCGNVQFDSVKILDSEIVQ